MNNIQSRAIFYNTLPYGYIITDNGIIFFNREYAKLGTGTDQDTRPERKEYQDRVIYLYKDSYYEFPLLNKHVFDTYRIAIVNLSNKYKLHSTEPYTYENILGIIDKLNV